MAYRHTAPMDVRNAFPQRLRDVRAKYRLTLMQVAEELEVSKSAVCWYESGVHCPNARVRVRFDRMVAKLERGETK